MKPGLKAVPAELALAVEYHVAGRLEEARALYQKYPGEPDAMHLLGVMARQAGKPHEAIRLIRRAIEARPTTAVYHANLGVAYNELQEYAQALRCYRKAAALGLRSEELFRNLGNAHLQLAEIEAAEAAYGQALSINPDAPHALLGMSALLCQKGKFPEAAVLAQRVVASQPDLAEAHHRLGIALQGQHRLEEAKRRFQHALRLNPRDAQIWNNLANTLMLMRSMTELHDCLKQAVSLHPEADRFFSSLLFTEHFLPQYTAEALFQEHCRFAARYEEPLAAKRRPHRNQPDPNRKLRIGYVSPDFRRHAMQYFIEPIIQNHDHAQFEVHCYHNCSFEDEVTARIRQAADSWVPCFGMSDEQLAERIHKDRIDVLIDLTGHCGNYRLLTFARKPAPVQVTWMGYPNTTGLRSMDYRITDALMDPVGVSERYHTEALVRLPYAAGYVPPDPCPEVSGLPALRRGTFTFACLNNPAKINPALVTVWARILKAVPGSRLLLGSIDAMETRNQLTQWFAAAGVDESRLELLRTLSMPEYLAVHAEVDLALDPFPYCGGTSTNHSLWMGVPVLTRVGETSVSRIGSVLMTRAGLPEFITQTADEYVERAVAIASDLPTLEAVRLGLRERMRNQAALDPAVFIKYVEQAFRDMWQRWCTERSQSPR